MAMNLSLRPRQWAIFLTFAAGFLCAQGAVDRSLDWVTPAMTAPRVVHETFRSASAEGPVSYHLYIPPAYRDDPPRRFPVVYWLHGSGGGLPGIAPLARQFDAAIAAGKVPPCLVVFVNGLKSGMYVDWKDGSAPVETVIVRDLISHLDATYRTIATREGRLIDGFSMGGYGAARLGFKFPEVFGSVSLMGAGPLQPDIRADAPRAGKARVADLMKRVYGGDPDYFGRVSPRALAALNAPRLTAATRIRMVVGTADETYANNVAFHAHLQGLGIPHEWIVLDGVDHDPLKTLRALGDRHWAFYREAFTTP
ncbi:MAG: esterase family protein [Verrucomicrobia bacterium]|nr:esterase family protein [Verrucomicrobiota bacterium]